MIAGIDPGVSGAIAWLDGDFAIVADIPTSQRGRTGSKQQVNAAVLAELLRANGRIEHCYLEHVMGAPRRKGSGSVMGAASAFNFGHSFGVIQGVLGALSIPYSLVTPAVWKQRANLIGAENKDLSRTRAIELFPALASQLARKRDVGRGEALLIARYGGAR